MIFKCPSLTQRFSIFRVCVVASLATFSLRLVMFCYSTWCHILAKEKWKHLRPHNILLNIKWVARRTHTHFTLLPCVTGAERVNRKFQITNLSPCVLRLWRGWIIFPLSYSCMSVWLKWSYFTIHFCRAQNLRLMFSQCSLTSDSVSELFAITPMPVNYALALSNNHYFYVALLINSVCGICQISIWSELNKLKPLACHLAIAHFIWNKIKRFLQKNAVLLGFQPDKWLKWLMTAVAED